MKQFRPILALAGCAAAIAVLGAAVLLAPGKTTKAARALVRMPASKIFAPRLERDDLPALLGEQRLSSNHLKLDYFPVEKDGKSYQVQFTLDRELQEMVESVYERYSPSYAAFVAMDPETGKILAMADYSARGHHGNLALQATFPAASIFKVVTSAAALDSGKIRPRAMFPVNGRYATLYKTNLRDYVNRWTRYISIEEAFAKSVNTVFGKIAMNRVGPAALQKYADGFGFNQHLQFDMPMQMGAAVIPTDDEFGLAESGSGYTRRQTLNPIQGAMIAAAIVNGGNIPAPHVVESVSTIEGTQVYEAELNNALFHPIDAETAKSLAMIMEHTVTGGTARKEYRDYDRHPILSKLFIGAKTGSLSGTEPAGKYDWFVGFARLSSNPKRKIAFASMIVNNAYWRVKASHVAREAILEYFKDVNSQQVAKRGI